MFLQLTRHAGTGQGSKSLTKYVSKLNFQDMRKMIMAAAVLALGATGCLDSLTAVSRAQAGAVFEEDREYDHALFETVEQCQKYQQEHGTWFNCFQTVEFMRDGHARLVLTDIVNSGSYQIAGSEVIFTPSGPSDGPALRFRLTGNRRALIRGEAEVWELKRSGCAD
jgi:hypothetical protein